MKITRIISNIEIRNIDLLYCHLQMQCKIYHKKMYAFSDEEIITQAKWLIVYLKEILSLNEECFIALSSAERQIRLCNQLIERYLIKVQKNE